MLFQLLVSTPKEIPVRMLRGQLCYAFMIFFERMLFIFWHHKKIMSSTFRQRTFKKQIAANWQVSHNPLDKYEFLFFHDHLSVLQKGELSGRKLPICLRMQSYLDISCLHIHTSKPDFWIKTYKNYVNHFTTSPVSKHQLNRMQEIM